MSSKRKDVHRPSALVVEDYEFIKFDYLPGDGDVLGNAMFLAEGRAYFRAHMEKTGGHYGENHSAGNCYICGARCIYSATFWHKPSLISTFTAVWIVPSSSNAATPHPSRRTSRRRWRPTLESGRRRRSLRRPVCAKAWALCGIENRAAYRKAFAAEHKAWLEANADAEPDYYGNVAGAPKYNWGGKDEMIVLDMVAKVVKYGNPPSDKALGFMKVLLDRIERAPEIAAEKAAAKAVELANSKPVPVVEGRVKIAGEVLTIKEQEGFYGVTTKMLVKSEAGFKLWGTVPSNLMGEVERGSVVEFNAKIQRSDDDEYFGFFSRPSKAKVIKALAA